MRHVATLVFGVFFSIWLQAGYAQAHEDECQALFAHSASEVSFDGSTITMHDASPNVIYFCDRPVRLAGHLTVDDFFETVSGSEDPFSKNPPNAVLSVIPENGEPVDVVVTIQARPSFDGNNLTYSEITVLEGNTSKVKGSGTIFIDHFGRPMSPGSVAGVHRRHDRREVRRCAAGVTCY